MALVTTSKALVPSSFLLLLRKRDLFLVASLLLLSTSALVPSSFLLLASKALNS